VLALARAGWISRTSVGLNVCTDLGSNRRVEGFKLINFLWLFVVPLDCWRVVEWGYHSPNI